MDSTERAALIREGNRAFNDGDYPRAREIFTRAQYGDGLVRIGDYYMYERRLPLLAYGYYKKAGAQNKIADLHRRMLGALGEWLGRDKFRAESARELGLGGGAPRPAVAVGVDGMIPVPVAPELKQMALAILQKRN